MGWLSSPGRISSIGASWILFSFTYLDVTVSSAIVADQRDQRTIAKKTQEQEEAIQNPTDFCCQFGQTDSRSRRSEETIRREREREATSSSQVQPRKQGGKASWRRKRPLEKIENVSDVAFQRKARDGDVENVLLCGLRSCRPRLNSAASVVRRKRFPEQHFAICNTGSRNVLGAVRHTCVSLRGSSSIYVVIPMRKE